MRHLLINADDYGLHPDIDRAIEDCVYNGAINSVSITPSSTLNRDFLQYAQRIGTKLGLHALLVDEPWLTKNRIWNRKTLFIKSFVPRFREEIITELIAQVGVLKKMGITIDHIDSHQHIHSFPTIYPLFRFVQHRFSILRMRSPLAASPLLIRPTLEGLVLQLFAMAQHNLNTDYRCIGISNSGRNTLRSVSRELSVAKNISRLEIILHPGVSTNALTSTYGNWNYDWGQEFELLHSLEFRQQVDQFLNG